MEPQQLNRRLHKLEKDLLPYLPIPYHIQSRPDGTLIMIPDTEADRVVAKENADAKEMAYGLFHYWRCRGMNLSKTDSEILLRDKPEVGRDFIRALGKKLTPPDTLAAKIDTHKTPKTQDERKRQKGKMKVRGGFVDMQARLQHLSQNRPFPVKPAGTPGRKV